MDDASEQPAELYARRAHITLEMYRRMIDADILNEDDRVELVHGLLIAKEPQSFPHADTIQRLTGLLVRGVGEAYDVRVQLPLTLEDDSEPEPDFAVVHRGATGLGRSHPATALLVVEVAKSSVRFDRTVKAALYALSGIPEYWVVDVENALVHVMRDPDRESRTWRHVAALGPEDDLAPAHLPGPALRVKDLLP